MINPKEKEKKQLTTGMKRALWIAPVFKAFSDSAMMADGLYQTLIINTPFIVTSSTLNIFTSLGLSELFTVDGMEETVEAILNGERPASWPSLTSSKHEIAAGILTALIVGCALFNDASDSYHFNNALPETYHFQDAIEPYQAAWKTGSGIVTALVCISMAFGEGQETYRTIRHLLSSQTMTFSSRYGKIIAITIGGTIAVIAASEDALNNFISTAQNFELNSTSLLITVGALSACNGITDFCLNGRFGISSMDSAIQSLRQTKLPKKMYAAFFLSAAGAGLLAYAQYLLTQSGFQSAADNAQINAPHLTDPAITSLAWGEAGNELLVDTATLFPLMLGICTLLESKLNAIYAQVQRCRRQARTEETHPLLAKTKNIESINQDVPEEEKRCPRFKDLCRIL